MLPLFPRIYWKLGMDFEIKDNFLIGAKQQLSPNSSDRTNEHDISLLIIHNISLPPGVFGTGYVDQFFCNNLMYLSNKKQHLQCGIIDYQDAIFGDSALDIVSLLEDSRRIIQNYQKTDCNKLISLIKIFQII